MCLIANRIINKRKGNKQKLKQYIRLTEDVAELIKYYCSMTSFETGGLRSHAPFSFLLQYIDYCTTYSKCQYCNILIYTYRILYYYITILLTIFIALIWRKQKNCAIFDKKKNKYT